MVTQAHPEAFVRWLRQVAPYVHAFRGRTFVIGFGGEVVAERARFVHFVHDINLLAALGIRLVLVHGARPQIDAELKAKRLRARFVKGLRITDAPRSPRSSTPPACCASRSRRCCRRACPTRRWRARASAWPPATTSPRGRSASSTASTSSSPAPCAGSTRRRSPRGSTPARWCSSRTSATRRPARSSTSPGRTWRRASPSRSRPTSCCWSPTGCRPNRKGEVRRRN